MGGGGILGSSLHGDQCSALAPGLTRGGRRRRGFGVRSEALSVEADLRGDNG